MELRGKRLVVEPGIGIGPFRLGMTRAEIVGITREPLHSFFPQTGSKVRSDELVHLGVTVAYDDNVDEPRANHLSGASRLAHGLSEIAFEGETIRTLTRAALRDMLTILEARFAEDDEKIRVASLGITFGFRDQEPASDDDLCDWVVVEPIVVRSG
jgi:hypothetical protein